MTQTSVGAI